MDFYGLGIAAPNYQEARQGFLAAYNSLDSSDSVKANAQNYLAEMDLKEFRLCQDKNENVELKSTLSLSPDLVPDSVKEKCLSK